jgi:aryl-phospho-beta-D-glucosidase BglC (GH1 family)
MPATPAPIKIVGATPANTIEVFNGDILYSVKPLVEKVNPDGTLSNRYSVWIDRQNGKGFNIKGNLLPLGMLTGLGYRYQVVGGLDRPVVVEEPAAPKTCSSNIEMPAKPLFGINISGGEFMENGALIPTVKSVNEYLDKGFNFIRLPFHLNQMTNVANRTKLVACVQASVDRNVRIVLDLHMFDWYSTDKFIKIWSDFMAFMPKSDLVFIGLMNEPKNFSSTTETNDWLQWVKDTQVIIDGLRAKGLTNVIAVGWPQWQATFRFDKNEGPTKAPESAGTALDRVGGLKDPLGKIIFEGHSYLDKGSSGTSNTCDIHSHAAHFATGLRKRGLVGFIGECAGGSAARGVHATCSVPFARQIQEIKDNGDALLGVTWWGGGSTWKEDYIFKVEPKKGTFATAPNSDYLNMILAKD